MTPASAASVASPSVHSFNQIYLLRAYGVPGTVLDAEKAVNKASKDACLCGACLLGGRQAGKETDNYKMNMEET